MSGPVDDPAFDAAVAAIRTAADEPTRWPDALAAIAACTSDLGAILFFQEPDGAFNAIVTPNLQETLADFSRSEWRDKDFRFMRAAERGFVQSGQCVTDRDVATEDEVETHPYYGFLRRHGLKYFAGLNVSPSAGVAAALSVQRSADRSPFSDEELALVSAFGEPLRTALARNAARLATATKSDLSDGLEAAGLDPHGETAALLTRLSGHGGDATA